MPSGALAVDANWLYLGGDFTSPGTHIAKGLPDHRSGRPDLERDGRQAPVRDMVLVGTTLYLVGDFTKVNGVARQAGGRGTH